MPSEQAKLLDFLEIWTLKESESCTGEPACEVSVAPVFNSIDPLNSTALITATAICSRLEQSHKLFLCPQDGTRKCLVPTSVRKDLKLALFIYENCDMPPDVL